MDTIKILIGVYPISTAPIREAGVMNLKFAVNFRFWRQYDIRRIKSKNITADEFTLKRWCELAEKIKREVRTHVDLDDEMHTSFDVVVPTNITPERRKEFEETVIRLIKEVYGLGDRTVEISYGRDLADLS